jgi:hypothetical protein
VNLDFIIIGFVKTHTRRGSLLLHEFILDKSGHRPRLHHRRLRGDLFGNRVSSPDLSPQARIAAGFRLTAEAFFRNSKSSNNQVKAITDNWGR